MEKENATKSQISTNLTYNFHNLINFTVTELDFYFPQMIFRITYFINLVNI